MACRVGLIAVVAVLSACTTGARESSASLGSSETNVPIVTPTNAYGPFPYANEVQRHAFQAFLACADGQGVEYRGPYADSSGKGVLFTLAEGEKVSQAERLRVDEHCPQMIVGIFATPGSGGFDASLFERAARQFATCLRSNGAPDFPVPQFDGDDPYSDLARLPFDWENDSFVLAASKCTDPLHAYVFSSLG
jgi:hypothetical protein